jgi:hypothetical protein
MATNNDVYCTAYRSCQSANMYLNNGKYAAITCDHEHSSSAGSTVDTSSEAPCYYSYFHALNVTNYAYIYLSSSYAAYYSYFYFGSTNDVQLSADGYYASYVNTFYAAQTSNLDMTCDGNYACYVNNFYCPRTSTANNDYDECSIECSGGNYACYYSDVYIPDDIIYDELDLVCDGQTSCYASTLYCTKNSTYGYPTSSSIYLVYDNSTGASANGSWTCGDACWFV